MTLRQLNTICYALCIISIAAGVVFALVIIWGDVEDKIAWKGFLTIAVFFLASSLTLSVNRLIERSDQSQS